mgnify:CR=1 FL=1
MSERKLYSKFRKKILKTDPNCWVYKIPDFALGGKRPFDTILIIQGIPFAIEFKSKNGQLTKYQAHQLQEVIIAGGESLIYWEERGSLDDFIEHIVEKIHRR